MVKKQPAAELRGVVSAPSWSANINALNATRAIAILDRAWDLAFKRGDARHKDACCYGIAVLQQTREASREHIAHICAPWFDSSALDRHDTEGWR